MNLISIVIPVYCSEKILPALCERISRVMVSTGSHYELILIDDGSADNSYDAIRRLSEKYRSIRGIRLARNFGHQAAVLVGLRESKGECVVVMDDDLQDPPEILPEFLSMIENGNADVVYGVRKKRKEGLLKKLSYKLFYRFLQKIAHIDLPVDAGDFCAMRRCVVDSMLRLHSARPYLRGMRSWVGFRQVGHEYERAARFSGASGYSFKKYLKFATTAILAFSFVPLRLATYLGVITIFLSFVFACAVVWNKFFGTLQIPGYASIILIVTFLGAVQLVCTGIIGEYVARLLEETRRWPNALIAESTCTLKADV